MYWIVTFHTEDAYMNYTDNEKSIKPSYNSTLISEIIGALVSILFLWILTGVLVYLGVERIINPDYTIDPLIMLITASIGVVINVMYDRFLIFNYWFEYSWVSLVFLTHAGIFTSYPLKYWKKNCYKNIYLRRTFLALIKKKWCIVTLYESAKLEVLANMSYKS